MAKGGHFDPAAEERRKLKQREIRKGKELKQQQKLERLKTIDPARLQRRIDELEVKKERNNGKLGQEERVLLSLKKDLESVQKARGGLPSKPKETVEVESKTLGKRSVFYHPEWNPTGDAPFGLPNVESPLINTVEIDPEISSIPLPSSPPPKFYKINVGVIEKEAEVQGTVFVPSAVRKRKLEEAQDRYHGC